jgi:nitric oxide reductase subunit B
MKKFWMAFILVVVISFSILGWAGFKIYQEKPPIPSSVVTTEGATVISEGDILAGQGVWRAMDGMELGSIWGHGSYVAPDTYQPPE